MLFRSDEITEEKDAKSLIKSSYMGASLLATAHCKEIAELENREIYRQLIKENIFDYIVEIKQRNSKREFLLYKKGGTDDKAHGDDNDNRFIRIFGGIHS